MSILCYCTSFALVTRISKLNDVVTNVGQMFNYTIPKNTFDQQETVSRYEVRLVIVSNISYHVKLAGALIDSQVNVTAENFPISD